MNKKKGKSLWVVNPLFWILAIAVIAFANYLDAYKELSDEQIALQTISIIIIMNSIIISLNLFFHFLRYKTNPNKKFVGKNILVWILSIALALSIPRQTIITILAAFLPLYLALGYLFIGGFNKVFDWVLRLMDRFLK